MSGQTRFRVLTAEGLVSHEVFTIAPFQPPNMARGNVLLACQSGGFPVMVHESRLIPLSMPKHHGDGGQIAACHKCGRVEGISRADPLPVSSRSVLRRWPRPRLQPAKFRRCATKHISERLSIPTAPLSAGGGPLRSG